MMRDLGNLRKRITKEARVVALAFSVFLLMQSFSVSKVMAQGYIFSQGAQPVFRPFTAIDLFSSQPYVGGYMATDDIVTGNPGEARASALRVTVSFLYTNKSIIQSDNFLAAGIAGQGPENDTSAPSVDYAYSLALVLDGSLNYPYIEGAIWACYEWGRGGSFPPKGTNPLDVPVADLVSSWKWWYPGVLDVNSVVTLTMSFSTTLNYFADFGGNEYALYSYAPAPYEQNYFMLGTEHRHWGPIDLGGTMKFFQFVGATSKYNPWLGWFSHIIDPGFILTNETSTTHWRPVEYAYATQGSDAWLDYTSLWAKGSYDYAGAHYYYDGNYSEGFGHVLFYPTYDPYFGYVDTDTLFWDPAAQSPPRGAGCPFVSAWNDATYAIDDNILPSSEKSNGTDVKDYYKMEQPLVPTHVSQVYSAYSLQVSEFEYEHSYLDQVKLCAVDHGKNVSVGVSPTGQILTYQDPQPPTLALDDSGRDVLQTLSSIDDNYYQSKSGGYLTFCFGDVMASNAKLILREDPLGPRPIKDSIHVQLLANNGSWLEMADIPGRVNWATDILDLSSNLQTAHDPLTMRLYFTAVHRVDYVALDTTPQTNTQTRQALLVSAVHSAYGNVLPQLKLDDGHYAQLTPGQQITLTFQLPTLAPSQIRTFILYSEGHYFTCDNNH